MRWIVVGVALGACGGEASFSDARAIDARPLDAAAPVDADPTPVTLTAGAGFAAPMVGATVVFLDPADGLIADTVTDADGVASASMPDGGSVLFFSVDNAGLGGPPPIANVFVWSGVHPGDQLVYGRPVTSTTNLAVTLPVSAGATQYVVNSGCDSSSSATPSLNVGVCAATTDLYVEADNLGGFVEAFRVDGVATTAPLDLSASSYGGARTIDIAVTNPPADATTTYGFVTLRGDTIPFPMGNLGTVGVPVVVPDVTGGVVALQFTIERSGHRTQQILATRPLADTITIDASAGLVEDPGAPIFAVDSGDLTWSNGGAIDHAIATVTGSRAGAQVRWTVSQPGDVTTTHLPRLPAGHHDGANLLVTDTPVAAVQVLETGDLTTEAAVTADPFDLGLPLGWAGTSATLHVD